MTPRSETGPESVIKEIKRKTRRKFSTEEKIRIVLEGLKGEASIAELSPRELACHITPPSAGLLHL